MSKFSDFINNAYFRARIIGISKTKEGETVRCLIPIVYYKDYERKFFTRKVRMQAPPKYMAMAKNLIGKEVYIVSRVMLSEKLSDKVGLMITGIKVLDVEHNDLDLNYEKRKFYENLEKNGGLGFEL